VLGVIFSQITSTNFGINYQTVFEQKQQMVDLLADDFEEDIALWGDYTSTKDLYVQSLISDMELIDRQPHTIGVMYDASFNQVSRRVNEQGVPDAEQYIYDPKAQITDFNKLVTKDSGTITVRDTEYGKIALYYRWLPQASHEYLYVAGISENAVAHVSSKLLLLYLFILFMCACIPVIDSLKEQGGARHE